MTESYTFRIACLPQRTNIRARRNAVAQRVSRTRRGMTESLDAAARIGADRQLKGVPVPRQELRDLFVLKAEEVAASATQRDLAARHSAHRISPPGLDDHLAAVARLPNFVGARTLRHPPAARCQTSSAARHNLRPL